MSIPQLKGLKDEMIHRNKLVFNTDQSYALRLKAIDNELKLANDTHGFTPKWIWSGFQKPKSLNPYNALWGAVPKSAHWTPWIPIVAASEYITYNAA